MAQDVGDVETIDAPLQPDEDELVGLLDESIEARRAREDAIVAVEATPAAPDSEYFTAPLLDENDNEIGR